MKNTAKQLLGICIIAVFTFSCTNEKTGHNTENMGEMRDDKQSMDNSANDGMDEHGFHESDSAALNYREGVPINDRMGDMDTLQLPKPILDAIAKDSLLFNAMIVQKIKREDSGQTVFEVSFYPVNGKEESVVFDVNGQRKQ
ncbi:hypothetical protein M3O96_20850 [Aquiflexum sp. TKW24L]|uniref:hypothetical protein n=1 Tax=Aquiflexum sp. TKW24L TaxID=2942212 RepID=UPI0020C16BB2|nr:hypothetical protein [Aquiflexum sp. TKW24L]MCL6261562.1 hypothetical protein [Aquiflexum sp. TKW24L]